MALQVNLTYLCIDWVCSTELFEIAFVWLSTILTLQQSFSFHFNSSTSVRGSLITPNRHYNRHAHLRLGTRLAALSRCCQNQFLLHNFLDTYKRKATEDYFLKELICPTRKTLLVHALQNDTCYAYCWQEVGYRLLSTVFGYDVLLLYNNVTLFPPLLPADKSHNS